MLFFLLFRVLSDATLWRHSHRFVPSFISNSSLHGYSQNTRKGTHAALCSNALGCFTFRVAQKGVWGEEGSVESRHILGQPQSLSQFFPRLFYSFHPHSEKSLSFFPLYIQPICPIKYISSSLIRKKKLCQPEFN